VGAPSKTNGTRGRCFGAPTLCPPFAHSLPVRPTGLLANWSSIKVVQQGHFWVAERAETGPRLRAELAPLASQRASLGAILISPRESFALALGLSKFGNY